MCSRHIFFGLCKRFIVLGGATDLPLQLASPVLSLLIIQPLVLSLLDGLPHGRNAGTSIGRRRDDPRIDEGHLLEKVRFQLGVSFFQLEGAMKLELRRGSSLGSMSVCCADNGIPETFIFGNET